MTKNPAMEGPLDEPLHEVVVDGQWVLMNRLETIYRDLKIFAKGFKGFFISPRVAGEVVSQHLRWGKSSSNDLVDQAFHILLLLEKDGLLPYSMM